MKKMLIALLLFALVPATAFAGGGSSKPTSTFAVKNSGTDTLAVIIDPPSGFNPSNLSAFTAAGGKIANPNETLTFKVKAGSHVVGAAFISSSSSVGTQGSKTYDISKNVTITVTVTGNSSSSPSFSP